MPRLTIQTAWISLFLALALGRSASAQDDKAVKTAQQQLQKAMKSDSEKERRNAISLVVETRQVKAVDVLITALHAAEKTRDTLEPKLEKLRKEFKKLSDEFDKRANGRSSIPMGDVENIVKKMDEVQGSLTPLEADWRLESATRDALQDGVGDLIVALPESDQAEQTQRFIGFYEKLPKDEDKLFYLDLIGHIRTQNAVAALVGVVSTSTSPEMRVAGLNALAELGDSKAAPIVVKSLDDEYWQVRAAAIAALSRFGSMEAVTPLIELLARESGRLKGDIIEALSSMTGINRRDNVELWKRWWADNQAELEKTYELASSDNIAERRAAMEKIGTNGFLLAARRLLEREGLSLNAVRAVERRRSPDDPELKEAVKVGGEKAGGFEAQDQEGADLEEAVGRAIGSRDPELRDAVVSNMILEPLDRCRDAEKRARFLRILGRTGTESAAKYLARVINPAANPEEGRNGRSAPIVPPKKAFNRFDLEAAITGLGFCARAEQIDDLVHPFSSSSSSPELLLVATRSLASLDSSLGVRGLIAALGEVGSRSSNSKTDLSGVAKAITDALRSLTKQDLPEKFEPWRDWWKTAAKDFRTEHEKEVAAQAGGAKKQQDDNPSGTSFYGIRTFSKCVAYVLDVSGSMEEPAAYAGELRKKIDVAKEELEKSIASLPPDAKFNIVFYSSDYRLWQKQLVVATAEIKAQAKTWIREVEASGATNIYDPLVKAFELAGRGSHDKAYSVALDTIFFLSDGQPNRGKFTNPDDILREILALNSLKRVQIHTIGIGKDHNQAFMRALANSTGGTYVAP